MGTTGGLVAVFILVLASAFFVLAEYALITSRRSALSQRAEDGSGGARVALSLMDQPVVVIGTVQIAITGLGILLGAVGESALRGILSPLLAAPIAFTTSFLIVTYLSVAFGELLPKALALHAPDGVAVWVSRPILLCSKLFAPAVWLLQKSTELILRPLGIPSVTAGERPVNREELRQVLQDAEEHGTLRPEEEDMLTGVIDLRSREARDVMVPWEEVTVIELDTPLDELLATVRDSPHSRYPAMRDGEIAGVLHGRDLWRATAAEHQDVTALVRDPVIVPPTVRLDALLRQMRRVRQHLAVVLGEYGSPIGIVTMEDIVEEIVGEIEDEFDVAHARVRRHRDGSFTVDGRVSLADFNRVAGTELPSDHAHSVGGLVFDELGRKPEVGDEVQMDGVRLRVDAVEGHRIDTIKVDASADAERAVGGSAAG